MDLLWFLIKAIFYSEDKLAGQPQDHDLNSTVGRPFAALELCFFQLKHCFFSKNNVSGLRALFDGLAAADWT